MIAALALHDALLPRPPGGGRVGVVAALALHAGLLFALATVVQWRTQPDEVFTAELWDRVPQAAPTRVDPPPPPAPPPSPVVAPRPPAVTPDAEISTEQQARQKAALARQQAERDAEKLAEKLAEKQATRQAMKQAAADKAKAEALARQDKLNAQAAAERAEDDRIARQRDANLKRIMGSAASAEGSGGNAARDGGPSAGYMARLAAQIRRNLVYTGQFKSGAAAEVMVRAGPSGTLISRVLTRSSGHPDWDEAVLRALDATSRLEPDVDGRVPAELIISFRPGD